MDEKNERGAMNKAMAKPNLPHKNIQLALLYVQSELPKLKKDKNNPFFKSKYVPLEQVIEVVLPILNKHGIVLVQTPTTLGGQPALKTILWHVSDEKVEDTMLLSSKTPNDPQAQGSAITYARRYALMSLLGLIGDEDDDGNRASQPAKSFNKWQDVPAYKKPAPMTQPQKPVQQPIPSGAWEQDLATEPQRKMYFAMSRSNQLTPDEAKEFAKERFQLGSFSDITKKQISTLIDELKEEQQNEGDGLTYEQHREEER